jgi:hypothetical protein
MSAPSTTRSAAPPRQSSCHVEFVPVDDADWTAVGQLDRAGLLCAQQSMHRGYPSAGVLRVTKGDRLEAAWPIPLMSDDRGTRAARPFRALPYTVIALRPTHPKGQRELVSMLACWCVANLAGVSLPLDVDCVCLAPFVAVGMSIEWRHTSHLDLTVPLTDQLSSSARNHLSVAARAVRTKVLSGAGSFAADRAIVDEGSGAKPRRIGLVNHQLDAGQAVCIRAYDDARTVGECLMAWDASRCYLLHSWRERDAPRGVPTLLVARAFEWAQANSGARVFDLEGSVLDGVDRFFSSLGGQPRPYGFLHWERSGLRADTTASPLAGKAQFL